MMKPRIDHEFGHRVNIEKAAVKYEQEFRRVFLDYSEEFKKVVDHVNQRKTDIDSALLVAKRIQADMIAMADHRAEFLGKIDSAVYCLAFLQTFNKRLEEIKESVKALTEKGVNNALEH